MNQPYLESTLGRREKRRREQGRGGEGERGGGRKKLMADKRS
jgi:hypothetical protein